MERYGLYRSLVAGDRESRDVSQDTNFGTSYSYPVHGPCSTSDIHMYIHVLCTVEHFTSASAEVCLQTCYTVTVKVIHSAYTRAYVISSVCTYAILPCYYSIAVLGVIRHSASNSSSVTFPKSLDDLENTAYSTAIPAQITIPSDLLRERITKGGMYYIYTNLSVP